MLTKYKLIITLLAISLTVNAQNDIFEKFIEKDDITSVIITKKMFQLISTIPDIGLEINTVKDKISGLQILTTKDKQRKEEMKAEFASYISNKHEKIMSVKDGTSRVNIYVKQKGDKIEEMLLLTEDEAEYVVVRLLGIFTTQEILEISQSME